VHAWAGYTLGAATGLLGWVGTAALTGVVEAWDSRAYFALAVPAMAVALGLLGRAFPERTWRWVAAAQLAQLGCLWWGAGGPGNLFPLSLLVLALLGVPSWLAAWLGASTASRRSGAHGDKNDTTR